MARSKLAVPARARRRAWAFALGACLALPGAHGSLRAETLARLVVEPLELSASAELQWRFDLRVVNEGSSGLYADSLLFMLTDTGPGASPGGSSRSFFMPAVASAIGSISAGDSTVFQQSSPASIEQGTLQYRLYAHRSDGTSLVVESPLVRITPGPVSAEHPSEFLTAGGKKVEIVLFRSQQEGEAPGVLFVADEGSHARQLLATGLMLSRRGMTAAIVSLPGRGQSEGPTDAEGAQNAAAAGAALDRLKREPGVDPKRLAVWGVSQGAEAAAAVAGRRSDLAALVVQSGHLGPASPRKGHAATLVIHGEADEAAPPGDARAFAARLEKAGIPVETKFIAGAGHALPLPVAQRAAIAFLGARFTH